MGLCERTVTFDIITIDKHRMATDGVGVTSLVALPGCPLDCRYCINRDVLSRKHFRKVTAEQLVEEVMGDYCYYVATGGGVTFGGGESLLRAGEILEFRKLLRPEVKINVETSLNLPLQKQTPDGPLLDLLLENIDCFIVDIKSLDADVYRRYTGSENENVTDNLNYIVSKGLQKKCHIRIPVIPEFTTGEDAGRDGEKMREMGFEDVEIFNYVIR